MPTTERPTLSESTRKLVIEAYEAACDLHRDWEVQHIGIRLWCLGAKWDASKHEARRYLTEWALDDLRAIERADDDSDIAAILWGKPWYCTRCFGGPCDPNCPEGRDAKERGGLIQ